MDIYKCPKSIFENTFGKQKIFVFPPFPKVEPKAPSAQLNAHPIRYNLDESLYKIHPESDSKRENLYNH